MRVLSARAKAGSRKISMWIIASIAASLAAEIVLLPIVATAFSRVTVAGLVLNLIAVPLMTVAQLAGLVVACADRVGWLASAAGDVAALAATGLVESARLVEIAPWLTLRVPPPGLALVFAYYVALGSALWSRQGRAVAVAGAVVCGALMVAGRSGPVAPGDDSRLRLTVFDVGQGDAMLLTLPGGRAIMVDAGGAGIDGAAFDIGGRVLAPALWARGVRRLDVLALTHGDPDHIGGARALVRDFAPAALWEGIPVERHAPLQALRAAAREAGLRLEPRRAGDRIAAGRVQIRVLHPPAPDWERPRVRNDDSLVLEVRYGDTALLLTGDISAEIERSILPQLSPARVRILKVAHHGSRTSTSQELLDAWKPQVAVISCGRGNRFGHPAPEVVRRLDAAGVHTFRTDRDGQITVDTDGRSVQVRTFIGDKR